MSVRSIDRPGGASPPWLGEQEQIALYLMERPTRLIPIEDLSTSRILVGGMGILAGVAFVESSTAQQTITYIDGSASGAAQANNASLAAGAAGTLNWVTGFEINGGGATAGAAISATLTGIAGGTLTYMFEVPTGVGVQLSPIVVNFGFPGHPAAALASAITINVPSFGAGNTAASATIHGYTASSGVAAGVVTTSGFAAFELLDGLDANGELLQPITLGAGATSQLQMGRDGPLFRRGLFLNRIAGTIEGSVWVKV